MTSELCISLRAAFEFSLSNYLPEQAAFYAERYVTESRASSEALLMLGEAFYRQADYSRAHYWLSYGKGVGSQGRLLFSKVCGELGMWEEVLRVLSGNQDLSAPECYLLGVAYEKTDESTKAAEMYSRCLEICPLMWSAYMRLSVILAEGGKVAAADLAAGVFNEQSVTRILHKSRSATSPPPPKLAPQPSNGALPITLGKILRSFGGAVHTVHCFQGVSEVDKALNDLPRAHIESPLALGLRARAFSDEGRYVESHGIFCELAQSDPLYSCSPSSGVETRENCGCCNFAELHSSVLWQLRKDLELATLSARLLTIRRPSSTAWVVVGNCFSLQKDHDSAIRFLKRAIQVDPSSANALALLGLEYWAREKLDKAAECFDQAIAADNRCVTAWWGHGNLLISQEEWAPAYSHFSRAVTLNPLKGALRISLASLCAKMGLLDEAKSGYSAAISLEGSNAFALYSSGQLAAAEGRWLEATELLEKAKFIAPKEPAIHFALGQIWAKNGQASQAMCAFDAALEFQKDTKDQHLIRAAIESLPKSHELNWFTSQSRRVTSAGRRPSRRLDNRRN